MNLWKVFKKYNHSIMKDVRFFWGPTLIKRSRISHEKIAGLSRLYSSTLFSTSGVATRGLLPPITPGRMLPVSWYRFRILETQPWETRSCLEMTQGRTPAAAISTIFSRTWFGSGLPFMNTPPSWLTLPWPTNNYANMNDMILCISIKYDSLKILNKKCFHAC